MNDADTFAPKPRPLTGDDLERMRFDYDPSSDTLMVYLNGQAPPAVSVVVDDYLSYRVDPATEEVVGYQIDDFLIEAVGEVPSYRAMAEFLGIAPPDLPPLRDAMSGEARRRVAAEVLAGHLAPAGV